MQCLGQLKQKGVDAQKTFASSGVAVATTYELYLKLDTLLTLYNIGKMP